MRVRRFGDRWIAIAEIAGERETVVGMGTRGAVAHLLASLGALLPRRSWPTPTSIGSVTRLPTPKLRDRATGVTRLLYRYSRPSWRSVGPDPLHYVAVH